MRLQRAGRSCSQQAPSGGRIRRGRRARALQREKWSASAAPQATPQRPQRPRRRRAALGSRRSGGGPRPAMAARRRGPAWPPLGSARRARARHAARQCIGTPAAGDARGVQGAARALGAVPSSCGAELLARAAGAALVRPPERAAAECECESGGTQLLIGSPQVSGGTQSTSHDSAGAHSPKHSCSVALRWAAWRMARKLLEVGLDQIWARPKREGMIGEARQRSGR